MADSARATNAADNSDRAALRVATWLQLGGIVLLGALLRGLRLGEAPGGYLVFNEGFYLDSALRQARLGLLSWFVTPTQYDKPPLYQGVLSTLLRLHLPQVATARGVSVLAGVATIILTFLLGRLLFDRRTGMLAAAVLSVMPGVVLVDHNIQVDPLLVALTLAGVFFYVRAVKTQRTRDAALGGVLLGAAILTKQPAVLALPALAVWETWRTRGLGWIRERRVWWYFGLALGVGGSWYLLQLAIAPEKLLGEYSSTTDRSAMTRITPDFWRNVLASELAWMTFPVTALLALGGLCFAAWKRSSGDMLLLVFSAVYVAYYIGFHFHSYYLLPLAPFLALAVSRLCVGQFATHIPWPWARHALVGVLIAAMTLASLLMLGGQKWGRWSPMALEPAPDSGFERVRLYYDPDLDGYYGPAMEHMNPRLSATRATLEQFYSAPVKPGTENLYLSSQISVPGIGALPARDVIPELWLRPVLFGYAIGQRNALPFTTQQFTNARWTASRVGPWWRFGVDASYVPSVNAMYTLDSFRIKQ